MDIGGIAAPGDPLKSVKEQLRQVPNRGIGYGVLRYLQGNTALAASLRSLPQADISFNYLGQFDQLLPDTSTFRVAKESSGPASSLRGNREYLLNINGGVIGGQLRMDWTYSASLYQPPTIENLARTYLDKLHALIEHCVAPDAAGYTPSDFPEAGISQDELDALLQEFS